jgi:signal transduction histidine kinase
MKKCSTKTIALIEPEYPEKLLSAEVDSWLHRLRRAVSSIKLPSNPIGPGFQNVSLAELEQLRFDHIRITDNDSRTAIPDYVLSHVVNWLERMDDSVNGPAVAEVQIHQGDANEVELRCGGIDRVTLERISSGLLGNSFFSGCTDLITSLNSGSLVRVRFVNVDPGTVDGRLFYSVMKELLGRQQYIAVLHRIVHDLKNQVTALRRVAFSAIQEPSRKYQLFAELEKGKAEILARHAMLRSFFLASEPKQLSDCVPRDVLRGIMARELPLVPRAISVTIQDTLGSAKASIDAESLSSLLINLLRNAVDAMPSGGTLSIVATSAEGYIYLEVSDTGVGIERDLLPSLFTSMRSTKKGLGLGLATIKRIVDLYSGIVDVKSQPGHGTTFAIALQTL